MEWSANFSFDYYARILRLLSQEFVCVHLSQALETVSEKPVVCIRHDIDVDPERALPLAKIEHEHGLFSTYYVMINSPLYRIEDHINTLKKLLELGNEIGLHFWREKLEAEKIEVEIAKDCRELEEKLGIEVRSISFHRPPEFVLGSAPLLAGRVNAYCKKLMEWYISDSRGRFRAGEPVEAIKAKKGNLLQFLTHPIWWGENHASAIERITEWFNAKTKNFSEAEKREFAQKVYKQIPRVFEQIAVMP